MNAIDIESHPRIVYLNELSAKTLAQISLRKAQNWPDFKVGYYYLLDDGNRFEGDHATMAIPTYGKCQ
jgi:hypothetical protein